MADRISVEAIGMELYLDQLNKTEPFASGFSIKGKVFNAIKVDMAVDGFDPSKPVNVWKKPDNTRVRATGELSILRVTTYEKTPTSEGEVLACAVHTQ
ncbi:MAG: hypothetical protein WC683_20395 [bacterium]